MPWHIWQHILLATGRGRGCSSHDKNLLGWALDSLCTRWAVYLRLAAYTVLEQQSFWDRWFTKSRVASDRGRVRLYVARTELREEHVQQAKRSLIVIDLWIMVSFYVPVWVGVVTPDLLPILGWLTRLDQLDKMASVIHLSVLCAYQCYAHLQYLRLDGK